MYPSYGLEPAILGDIPGIRGGSHAWISDGESVPDRVRHNLRNEGDRVVTQDVDGLRLGAVVGCGRVSELDVLRESAAPGAQFVTDSGRVGLL